MRPNVRAGTPGSPSTTSISSTGTRTPLLQAVQLRVPQVAPQIASQQDAADAPGRDLLTEPVVQPIVRPPKDVGDVPEVGTRQRFERGLPRGRKGRARSARRPRWRRGRSAPSRSIRSKTPRSAAINGPPTRASGMRPGGTGSASASPETALAKPVAHKSGPPRAPSRTPGGTGSASAFPETALAKPVAHKSVPPRAPSRTPGGTGSASASPETALAKPVAHKSVPPRAPSRTAAIAKWNSRADMASRADRIAWRAASKRSITSPRSRGAGSLPPSPARNRPSRRSSSK